MHVFLERRRRGKYITAAVATFCSSYNEFACAHICVTNGGDMRAPNRVESPQTTYTFPRGGIVYSRGKEEEKKKMEGDLRSRQGYYFCCSPSFSPLACFSRIDSRKKNRNSQSQREEKCKGGGDLLFAFALSFPFFANTESPP